VRFLNGDLTSGEIITFRPTKLGGEIWVRETEGPDGGRYGEAHTARLGPERKKQKADQAIKSSLLIQPPLP
jgi:hypothetical protein